MNPRRCQSISVGAALALALSFVASAPAQTTQPATPLLQQISGETQRLYESIRPGLVEVRLPPPRWIGALMDENFNRWAAQLDPTVRAKVEAELKASGGGRNLDATISPASQPAASSTAPPRLRVIQRPDGGIDLIAVPPTSDLEQPISGAVSLGMVLDDLGHVLVPAYIEKESVGADGLEVYLGGVRTTRAKLIGSDQKTNLSVVQLETPSGKPVKMLGRKPSEGALVMVLLTNGESGELLIWTGGLRDSGAVITSDGSLAGFSRAGVFLDSEQIKPIVQQLIKFGSVKRAVLGVWVRLTEGAGQQPVVRVEKLFADSAASRAGIRVGDVIVAIAGRAVHDIPSFAAAIAAGNGATELEVLRDGETVKLTVDLQPR
jgi:S1-C subfamily serine protease